MVDMCAESRLNPPMDPQTFVLALLAVAVFGLAILVGLAHRDMTRAVGHMDGAVARMDHAVERMDRQAPASRPPRLASNSRTPWCSWCGTGGAISRPSEPAFNRSVPSFPS